MLTALDDVAPLLIVVLGMGVIGCVLAILWYRATAPDNFDRNIVFFLVKVFSGIAAVAILLGILMKR